MNLSFNHEEGTSIHPQIGLFSNGWEAIGISQGIILSSGEVTVAEGPNDLPTAFVSIDEDIELTEEPDLEELIGSDDLHDVAVLEFDFIAKGDTLRFSYVFASEEYNEHTCSPYNDAFGFFISGPGIDGNPDYENGALNLAKVPGSNTPVAINTVNQGFAGQYGSMAICNSADINWQDNTPYFVDNEDNNELNTTQFDGFTKVFDVEIPIQCGGQYHIKIAIADAVDGKNDSAVFIESESFASPPPLEAELEVIDAIDNMAFEGCSSYRCRVKRSDSTDVEVIYVQSEFIDENPELFGDVPESLTFYPQQGYLDFEIQLLRDNTFEGIRTVDLSFLQLEACGVDTSVTQLEIELNDSPEMQLTFQDTISFTCDEIPIVLVNVEGGMEPYTISWEDGYEGFSFAWNSGTEAELFGVVEDACSMNSDTVTIQLMPETYPPLSAVLPDSIQFNCTDPLTIPSFTSGGRGDYEFSWLLGNQEIGTDSTLNAIITQEGTLFLSITDGCVEGIQIESEMELAENPIFVDIGEDLEGKCDSLITIIPQVEGGFGSLSFEWKRNLSLEGTSGTFAFTPLSFSMVTLEVEDACGQRESDTLFVYVNNPPLSVDLPADTSICEGDRIEIIPEVSGGYGDYSYLWPERGSTSSSLNIIPRRDDDYTVVVTDECLNEAESTVEVFLVEVEADFEFDYENFEFPLNNLSSPGVSQLWTLPDGTTSELFEPYFEVNPEANQLVILEITHPIGCTDSKMDFFEPPLNVFIPNAFTPDGDGLNDVFKAEGTFMKSIEMWVFDRWGNTVFHTTEIGTGWDGSDPSADFSGQDLVYSYRIVATGFTGELIDKKGSVTVLR